MGMLSNRNSAGNARFTVSVDREKRRGCDTGPACLTNYRQEVPIMLKKLLAVALAVLATLMIVGCQQPNNVPEEKVDPNMPEQIYKNPDIYNTGHMVMKTRIGDIDFYLVTHSSLKNIYLLGFMHNDNRQEEQFPIVAREIYVGGEFATTGDMKGFVTKENVYAYKRIDIGVIPSVLDITGSKDLLSEDPDEMTQDYAGWAAIVPADPKANNPEKAKISDSIYVIYNEGLPYSDPRVSGEKDNISPLAGYGVWDVYYNYTNVKHVLPVMSDETETFLFGKPL